MSSNVVRPVGQARFESLERRAYFASVTLNSAGLLYVGGTDAGDKVFVFADKQNPGKIIVRRNGIDSRFAASGIQSIYVKANAGDDRVQVDAPLGFASTLCGGTGNDSLQGASGGDILSGGAGADDLRGENGDDFLTGGTGIDTLSGGDGADSLLGDASAEFLDGGTGVDQINGVNDTQPLPTGMVEFHGASYYLAEDGTNGLELWRTDGTVVGTHLVIDVTPETPSDSATLKANRYAQLNLVNGRLVFITWGKADGDTTLDLWSSDGTVAGTQLLKSIRTGGYFSPGPLILGSRLLIDTSDGNTWSTDGTVDGTFALAVPAGGWRQVISQDISGGSPDTFHRYALYSSTDPETGECQLWAVDGSPLGTTLLMTAPGTTRWTIAGQVDTKVLFFERPNPMPVGSRGEVGVRLHCTDGTVAGTALLKEFNTAEAEAVSLAGGVFFTTVDENLAATLWRTDGTDTGTKEIEDLGALMPNEFSNGIRSISLGVKNGRLAISRHMHRYAGSDYGWTTTDVIDPVTLSVVGTGQNQPMRTGTSPMVFTVFDSVDDVPLVAAVLLQNGVLRVLGTDVNDKIWVYGDLNDASVLRVTSNGLTQTFSRSSVQRIEIVGFGGYDELGVADNGNAVLTPARIWGGIGNDSIYGASGPDTIWGGHGDDVIDGGAGNDLIFCGTGNDIAHGGQGNDTLNGEAGNDLLFGDKHDDLLIAGDGISDVADGERLDGGIGADLLFVRAATESFVNGVRTVSVDDQVLLI